MRASLLALAAAGAAAAAAAPAPEQVFLTLAGDADAGAMMVSWVTMGAAAAPEGVTYGPVSGAHSMAATATSAVFDDGGAVAAMRIHVARLGGLAPNTTYYYAVGGAADERRFVNAPARDGGKVWAVFADLGLKDDYALATLLEDAAAGVFDGVIHAGDFAYNLEDERGAVGNAFMAGLQPVVASVPYLTCAGNHETEADDSFANYLARFAAVGAGAGAASGSDSARWYSFNDGPVHWVFFDTEVFSYGTSGEVAAQKAWLAADLAGVDRSATPWVLAAGHKAPWEKKTDWAAYLDGLFSRHQVDVAFVGHTHNYQRTVPVQDEAASDDGCVSADGANYTDCTGTVFVTVGSPGMDQGMGTRLAPQGVLLTSALKWGYGYLTVVSRGELAWHWFETVAAGPAGRRSVRVPRGAGAQDRARFFKTGV